jgi:SAM-dependent methyltransferase
MTDSKQAILIRKINEAVTEKTLLKITLGNKRDKTTDLKNVLIKPVLIKEQPHLSFVYRHNTNDITKNFVPAQAATVIEELLQTSFFNGDVYTTSHTIYYSVIKDGKEKLVTKTNDLNKEAQSLSHDKQKNRIIQKEAVYLNSLGITSAEGNVKKEMQHKYKQINRYVEIIEGILKDTVVEKDFSVVDMGSGKGYLTFALYDYLQQKYEAVKVTGIEMREDLVIKCNNIAAQSKYNGLHFEKGSIHETPIAAVDMLIALHACDTATDDAIAKGIKANAKYIICAPCCHKQIRKQMAPTNALKLITKHGILLERQAEMVTDTIRALILEAHGYKTKVFDFIEEEDTPKNVLIVGTKNNFSEDIFKENMDKVQELKNMFGIKEHYLEGVV